MNNLEAVQLSSKITALARVNSEIIASIENSSSTIPRAFQYRLKESSSNNNAPKFDIEEIVHVTSSENIVKNWKPKSNLTLKATKEMNLFNDNINYTINSFNDLKRLNTQIPTVAEKFRFLDPSATPPVLQNFLSNLEIIQVHLGQIQESLMGCQSNLESLQHVVAQLNDCYNQVVDAIKTTNGQYQSSTVHLNVDSLRKGPADNSTATSKELIKTAVGPAAITGNEGFESGIHKWSITYNPTDSQGWLLLAVQSSPSTVTAYSYCESNTYGANITQFGATSNGTYSAGKFNHVGSLTVSPYWKVDVELDCDNQQLTVSYGSQWSQTISLPSKGPWYPHFNSYSTSFSICEL